MVTGAGQKVYMDQIYVQLKKSFWIQKVTCILRVTFQIILILGPQLLQAIVRTIRYILRKTQYQWRVD